MTSCPRAAGRMNWPGLCPEVRRIKPETPDAEPWGCVERENATIKSSLCSTRDAITCPSERPDERKSGDLMELQREKERKGGK